MEAPDLKSHKIRKSVIVGSMSNTQQSIGWILKEPNR